MNKTTNLTAAQFRTLISSVEYSANTLSYCVNASELTKTLQSLSFAICVLNGATLARKNEALICESEQILGWAYAAREKAEARLASMPRVAA